jgi:MATE family multidrug resistance protein
MRLFNYRDKEILRLALPSIVQNVTVPLLGLADVAIMGHIGDARYIGAIAVGSMIFNVMYWLCGFLRMGTSGLTAQAYGKNRGERREERGEWKEESGEWREDRE